MYKIISTNNHVEWKKALSFCNEDCIFFNFNYLKIFEDTKFTKARLFFYSDKQKYFVFPFLITNLNKYGYKEYSKYYDLETPYGYGGFSINTQDVSFLNDAFSIFKKYCKRNKIVASFLRFNPFLRNKNFQKISFKIIYNRKIVYLDLGQQLKNIIKNSYSSNQRNMIRKARKYFIAKLSNKKKDFKNLINLYLNNMKKVNADKFYFFNNVFFEKFYSNLKDNFIILYALSKKTKKIISSILILFDKEIGYYFFSGKDNNSDDNSSTNFLLHKSMIVLKRKHIKYLNLGGGNSDNKNDPLYRFKKNVSNETKDFFIGTKIHNKKIYDTLIKLWNKKNPNSVNKNKFLKYRYND